MSRVAVIYIIAVVLATSLCSVAAEEQITIKVVDGRNGKPLKATTVDVWFGTKVSPPPKQVETATDGNVVVVTPDSRETVVIAGQRVADCRAGNESSKSYIEENVYRVHDILHSGVVAQNMCGKARDQPTPGVLVLYVRPLHWWEKMHD